MTKRQLQQIARQEGTPVVVIDHNVLRANYRAFHNTCPRPGLYAVKANPDPAIRPQASTRSAAQLRRRLAGGIPAGL